MGFLVMMLCFLLLGNDSYLVSWRKDGAVGTQHAFLESPVMTPQSDNCQMRFNYFMSGESTGGIKITLRKEASTTLLWSRFGSQSPNWLSSVVVVNASDIFQVTIHCSASKLYLCLCLLK